MTMLPPGMRTSSTFQHVATGWPNVAICCAEMLPPFGRSLQMLGQQCWNRYVAIVWPEEAKSWFSLINASSQLPIMAITRTFKGIKRHSSCPEFE